MTEPIGFLNYGWSYLRSAEYVFAAVRNDNLKLSFRDPITTLVGHSLELILKAYIWHASKKRAPFVHNLEELMKIAVKEGLQLQLTDDERTALEHLNKLVGSCPFEARYLLTGSGAEPQFLSWLKLARRIMDEVEPAIAPDRVRNVGLRSKLEPAPSLSIAQQELTLEQATERALFEGVTVMSASPASPAASGIECTTRCTALLPPSRLAGEGPGMGGPHRASGEIVQ